MNIFKTTDLYLAAVLYSCGLKISTIEPDGRRCIFCFIDNKERDETIRKFCNRELKLDIAGFIDSLKRLKSMTFNY